LPSFRYKKQESALFGNILRPLVRLEAYSEVGGDWLVLENVLADTGADISVLPSSMGEALVFDVKSPRKPHIKGIAPQARVRVYIHKLRFRLNSKEWSLPVAIADTDNVPPILGRVNGLDLFNANFKKGRVLSL
jgi:hypothetical protein